MYTQRFGLTSEPFSIAPDPRFLFMSERHREALAHQIAHMLGGAFVDDPHGEHGLAWSLCEWAGWP